MGKAVKELPANVAARADPAAVSAVAWRPGRDLDLAEWVYQGKRLGSIGRGASWWVGDWVNYGHGKWGEKYVRAAQVTGYDVQTLMNMAYVASRFEFSRRRENLSWSHHAEVAGLPPEESEKWLEFAEAGGVSVRGLREELRRWRAQAKREASDIGAEARADVGVEDGVYRDINRRSGDGDDGVGVADSDTNRDADSGTDRPDGVSGFRGSDESERCPVCGCVVHPAVGDVTRLEGRSAWVTI